MASDEDGLMRNCATVPRAKPRILTMVLRLQLRSYLGAKGGGVILNGMGMHVKEKVYKIALMNWLRHDVEFVCLSVPDALALPEAVEAVRRAQLAVSRRASPVFH